MVSSLRAEAAWAAPCPGPGEDRNTAWGITAEALSLAAPGLRAGRGSQLRDRLHGRREKSVGCALPPGWARIANGYSFAANPPCLVLRSVFGPSEERNKAIDEGLLRTAALRPDRRPGEDRNANKDEMGEFEPH